MLNELPDEQPHPPPAADVVPSPGRSCPRVRVRYHDARITAPAPISTPITASRMLIPADEWHRLIRWEHIHPVTALFPGVTRKPIVETHTVETGGHPRNQIDVAIADRERGQIVVDIARRERVGNRRSVRVIAECHIDRRLTGGQPWRERQDPTPWRGTPRSNRRARQWLHFR